MDEILGAILTVWLIVATTLAGMFVFGGTLNSSVIRGCADNGYWQTGQTRIICRVEGT